MVLAIWLFTFIAADLGAHELLPHFLDYYIQHGVPASNFVAVVNHDPAGPVPVQGGLSKVKRVLASRGVTPRYWLERFYPARKLKIKLEHMQGIPDEDWIVEVDLDEFAWFYGMRLTEFLAQLDQAGITWAGGRLVDRIAEEGKLTALQAPDRIPIWDQYPHRCNLTRSQKFKTAKIPLHRAFWRTNPGNHRIILDQFAATYFCGNKCRPGNDVKYRRPYNGDENLLYLTPYNKPENKARYGTEWQRKGWHEAIMLDHYKWHEGVKTSLQHRLEYYRGDASNGFQRRGNWEESQRFLRLIRKGVDMSGKECQLAPAGLLGDRKRCEGDCGVVVPSERKERTPDLDDRA